MPEILKTKSIYFNDVNLLPTLGQVQSRKDVPIELYRVIVSPMLSIVGETFAKESAKLGLSLTTPRFLSIDKKVKLFNIFNGNKKNDKQLCLISLGINEKNEDLDELVNTTTHPNILFDIANGYIPQLKDRVVKVYERLGSFNNLMLGNVVTSAGVQNLVSLSDFCQNLLVRIGIGNGKICQSSDSTGVNRGNVTELIECGEVKDHENKMFNLNGSNKRINLISDGGISKGGTCLKAWGAGADYVLMGSYFSDAIEAETNLKGMNIHFGCASERQNKLAGLDRHSEGKEFKINKENLKTLQYLVDELWGGISSGISYVGYDSVSNFIGRGVFERKENSLPPKGRI